MTSRSYFGKMNSTLGSVVPLAMSHHCNRQNTPSPRIRILVLNVKVANIALSFTLLLIVSYIFHHCHRQNTPSPRTIPVLSFIVAKMDLSLWFLFIVRKIIIVAMGKIPRHHASGLKFWVSFSPCDYARLKCSWAKRLSPQTYHGQYTQSVSFLTEQKVSPQRYK